MNIAILTSGGDSPGMNAAIRSAVRTSISQGHKVFGVREGYTGLVAGEFEELTLRSVANIIHRGGTFLKSSRSKEFLTVEGRIKAHKNLKQKNITSLIALGGDGTLKGLEVFQSEFPDIQVLGAPCTIDNDYSFSEETIGFDTAVNTAVDAVDKIRDTASSHQRTFVIEVMGRETSVLADSIGVSVGAECVVNSEKEDSIKNCHKVVKDSIEKGKKSSLVIVIEGQNKNEVAAYKIQKMLTDKLSIDCRAVVLGHIQRGGSPSARDRVLASEMTYKIGMTVSEKKSGVVVVEKGQVVFKSFSELKELPSNSHYRKIMTTLAN